MLDGGGKGGGGTASKRPGSKDKGKNLERQRGGGFLFVRSNALNNEVRGIEAKSDVVTPKDPRPKNGRGTLWEKTPNCLEDNVKRAVHTQSDVRDQRRGKG